MYKQLLKTLKNKESLSSTNGPFNGIITSFLRCYNNLTNGIIKYRTYGDISTVKLQCLMSFNIFYRIEFVSLICMNRSVVVLDRKSTRLNSSHVAISYAVFCLKK